MAITMLAVYARNDEARAMVAGFAASTPVLSPLWQQLDRALADVPALGSALARLTADLADSRRDRANLMAAIRAALAANADGEADPWYYLRDELDGQALAEPPGGDRDAA
jgi:predicted DNA-binding ribbon-helix-helix protein